MFYLTSKLLHLVSSCAYVSDAHTLSCVLCVPNIQRWCYTQSFGAIFLTAFTTAGELCQSVVLTWSHHLPSTNRNRYELPVLHIGRADIEEYFSSEAATLPQLFPEPCTQKCLSQRVMGLLACEDQALSEDAASITWWSNMLTEGQATSWLHQGSTDLGCSA